MPDNKLSGLSAGDTFIIDIKFRQNATWQGTVRCVESGQEMRFRSALEMLKLMDGVLLERHPEDEAP